MKINDTIEDDVKLCPHCHTYRGIEEYGKLWYCAHCRREYQRLRYQRRRPPKLNKVTGLKTCPICLEQYPREVFGTMLGYCPTCWNRYNNYRRRLLRRIGKEATKARKLADELRMYARTGKPFSMNLTSLKPIS